MKRTWILGAGFSVPLDGPTLASLFSEASYLRIQGTFPGIASETIESMREAQQFYARFATNSSNATAEKLWHNPEDFLDKLEGSLASPNDQSPHQATNPHLRVFAERIRGVAGHRKLAGQCDEHVLVSALIAAKRLLAAECYAFTRFANQNTEKWRSYVAWASRLTKDDTIVTFNYDRVLEIINEHLKSSSGQERFDFILPNKSCSAEKTPVLKLHGSVDWLRIDRGEFIRGDEDSAIKCSRHDQIAIATPGASKFALVQEMESHWKLATEAIRGSHHVIIIGYRMPETDAYAREQVLLSLKNARQLQGVEIVLGPDINSSECRRMVQLVNCATGQPGLTSPMPLWSQDYLAIRGLIA